MQIIDTLSNIQETHKPNNQKEKIIEGIFIIRNFGNVKTQIINVRCEPLYENNTLNYENFTISDKNLSKKDIEIVNKYIKN